jgi:hypothetical protein
MSLFTKVPFRDILNILSLQFGEDSVKLFHHVLTSSFFCFNDQFYEQTNVVAMGSPLESVTSKFFMKEVEELALSSLCTSSVTLMARPWYGLMDQKS